MWGDLKPTKTNIYKYYISLYVVTISGLIYIHIETCYVNIYSSYYFEHIYIYDMNIFWRIFTGIYSLNVTIYYILCIYVQIYDYGYIDILHIWIW